MYIYTYLQCVSFIAASNTAALSHRKPPPVYFVTTAVVGMGFIETRRGVSDVSHKMCNLLISNRFSALYGIFVFA
jgi:hypothetical protein